MARLKTDLERGAPVECSGFPEDDHRRHGFFQRIDRRNQWHISENADGTGKRWLVTHRSPVVATGEAPAPAQPPEAE